MKRVISAVLSGFLLLSAPLEIIAQTSAGKPSRAASASKAPTKTPSLDNERLERIPARMAAFVARGRAAGIVTLVAHRGRIANLTAVGVQDLETQTPMRTDTIFQVASMTKPVTAVGIMMLVEEGLLALTDPVEKHLPQFANIQLAERREGEDIESIRRPTRKFTIRDLLTHTSGMGSGYPPGFEELFNKRDRTLAEAVAAFPQRRLEFEPGTRWGYSNMGIATLGRIIEVVAGQRYEEFIATRIFQPLGMTDSHFFVPESKHSRIATIYKLEGDKLAPAEVDLYRTGAKYSSPEAGLYSTAPDLFRFYQMMLNGGVFNNQRLLSRHAVALMTSNHTGELAAGFAPGVGFGLGWSVVRNMEGMFRLNSIGTYGHGGLWRTYGFVDPKKELIGVILLQRVSNDGDLADEISAFVTLASAAVL
jgi:CubicO group peptidase (beta-lactamase class C family)